MTLTASTEKDLGEGQDSKDFRASSLELPASPYLSPQRNLVRNT